AGHQPRVEHRPRDGDRPPQGGADVSIALIDHDQRGDQPESQREHRERPEHPPGHRQRRSQQDQQEPGRHPGDHAVPIGRGRRPFLVVLPRGKARWGPPQGPEEDEEGPQRGEADPDLGAAEAPHEQEDAGGEVERDGPDVEPPQREAVDLVQDGDVTRRVRPAGQASRGQEIRQQEGHHHQHEQRHERPDGGHHLVAGQRAEEQADRHEHHPHGREPHAQAQERAHVELVPPLVVQERQVDGERHQQHQIHDHAGQPLRDDDLPLGDRQRHQGLDRPRSVLLRQQPHGQNRDGDEDGEPERRAAGDVRAHRVAQAGELDLGAGERLDQLPEVEERDDLEADQDQ
ncbi:hypothetical protein HK102_011877, partial [Quaeritorhiza haematococci]